MGKAKSVARKVKYDDALMKRIKTCENDGASAWSDPNHDVLFQVMMRLGVVDFFAFRGVCKSWRSLALSNMNKFIVSRPSMSIYFSPDDKENKCYLEDFEGRKFSTILPCSAGRSCIGVTCGYLILVSWKSSVFWLVNPITRHELHFPDVPSGYFCCDGYDYLRGILVFSPSISRWVFALLNNCFHGLCFSVVGTREWTSVSRYNFNYSGLHAFNGNIYTLTYVGKDKTVPPVFPLFELVVQEVRLDTEPKLVFERFQKPDFTNPKYVTSGEYLYVIDLDSKHPDMNIHELDLGKKKWMSRENTGEKYAFFRNMFKNIATITLQEVWAGLHPQ